jgi:preprotein translocase subunit SecF
VTVRLPLPPGGEAGANAAASKVRASLTQQYPGVKIDSVDTVSGKVSDELVRDGALALLLSAIGIVIYIWIRFEWQFGVGAMFSLVHDVTLTLGFFSLTQMEFDLNVVAALLTLIGYSLNDTIVIYDRVRENLRKYRKMEITPLLNLTMNETLSRTVATNFAMLLALGSLMLLGPGRDPELHDRAADQRDRRHYSTVYIAAPWLIWLKVNSTASCPRIRPGGGAGPQTYNELLTGAPLGPDSARRSRRQGFTARGFGRRRVYEAAS